LPDEIGQVDDLQAVRRYLPGYIESSWRGFLDHRMTAVRDQLAGEAESIEAQIRADLTELVDAFEQRLGGGVETFGGDSRLRAFVMPRRGQSHASKVARGLGLHAFVMLTISTIFLGFSPVPGLLALGASHVIRRVFAKDIERADREALVDAARAAARDAGIALRAEVNAQFDRLTADVQKEIAEQYAGALARIGGLLDERERQSGGIAERRERLATLVAETLPDLRRQVVALNGDGAR
ncbi:MAG TPA: hypothetical protein VFA78_07740, partial [Chloroflexota bacterium]|nr:hypothetical protein [Chloroflexota bacterium]